MTIFRKKVVTIKEKERIPNVRSLENEIAKGIIGQSQAVRKITTAIYRSKYFKSIRNNILIVGDKGVAKRIIKKVVMKLNIPIVCEKYYALNSNIIVKLLEKTNYNFDVAERGIIVIEDIDRKVDNASVMENFINFIESSEINVQIIYGGKQIIEPFSTKHLMLIFLGEFDGLKKIRDRRVNNSSGYGFGRKEACESVPGRILKQDIAQYEIPEEVIDKIDAVVEMNNPTKQQIVARLKKSKISIFRKYQNEIQRRGVELTFDDKIFETIAESSLKVDTSGKETSGIVNYIFENVIYDVLANPGKFKKCEMSLDIVKDNTKYKLS